MMGGMLTHTFLHLPGIGPKTEANLWASGIDDWDAFAAGKSLRMTATRRQAIADKLDESKYHLARKVPAYFAEQLPANQLWRIFPAFRGRTAYLDIETTGLDANYCQISTIAVYDGTTMTTYVQGRNLDDFDVAIDRYDVLVTYNGKCFDVPVIERLFKRRLTHAHIDLRYVLASMGIKGGLKQCEAQMGLHRGDMEDIDGLFAVVLWKGFLRNQDEQALEALLAYNLQDAINLEALMVSAFNHKVAQTPFSRQYRLAAPAIPDNPYRVHRHVIDRYRREAAFIRSLQPRW
jgi:uncharacterized protein YprB with RNaseH-like and TPR domain